MKRFLIFLTCFSFSLTSLSFGQEPIESNDIFYTDEDDELFNRGKFVGQEDDSWLRARRFERNKNWAVAILTTILGATTATFVGQHHAKEKREKKKNEQASRA